MRWIFSFSQPPIECRGGNRGGLPSDAPARELWGDSYRRVPKLLRQYSKPSVRTYKAIQNPSKKACWVSMLGWDWIADTIRRGPTPCTGKVTHWDELAMDDWSAEQVMDKRNSGNADDQHGPDDVKECETEGVIVVHAGP